MKRPEMSIQDFAYELDDEGKYGQDVYTIQGFLMFMTKLKIIKIDAFTYLLY